MTPRAPRLPVRLLAVLALAMILPMWRCLAGVDVHFLGDALRQRMPEQAVLGRLLAAAPSRPPVWNPSVFCGAPLLANPEIQAWYPPALLYRFLPFPVADGWFLALHLVLGAAGLAVFLLARGLGGRAAAIGALAYALGAHVHLLRTVPPALCGAAWLPWVALAAERARGGGARAVAWLGLALAWVVAAGNPPYALFASALALIVIADRGAPVRATAVRLGAGLGLAAAAAAAVWVPFLGYLGSTARGAALGAGAAAGAMSAWGLPGLLVPLALLPGGGDEPVFGAPHLLPTLHYVGTIPLALACSAPWLVARERLRVAARLVGVGLLLALGPGLPLVGPVFLAVPVLGWLRHAGLWGVLAGFGLAWLAAEGAHALELQLHKPAGRRVLRGWAAAVVFLGGVWMGGNLWHLGAFKAWLEQDAGPATVEFATRLGSAATPAGWLLVALIGLGLAARREIGTRLAFRFLAVLVWVDLGFHVGRALQPTTRAEWVLVPGAAEAYLTAAGGPGAWGRVLTTPRLDYAGMLAGEGIMGASRSLRAAFQSNLPAAAGLRQAGGIGPLRPAGTADAVDRATIGPVRPWDPAPAAILDRLGVRWIVAPSPLAGAGLVLRVRGAATVVERTGATLAPAWIEPAGAGRVRGAVSGQPGTWRVDAELAAPGRLVVAESWVRGWSAGEAGPVVADRGGLLSVALPAGRRAVTLRYDPPGLRAGFLASLIALVLLTAFALRPRRR